ncbi:HesA/MoeB/ThiF family protein [Syntrophobacter fumaroxidans]|uniref:UBA/THIF-type NAD/FAD binding protein n=1 Tax=Syntrophobacter fumaroxidans (strain DSM 10017 / MPOB) TaxID=335543 RepID=A0LK13_SYNFM|nr:HesA/MoeB/ThiF family protein [Syntrophobacter fumaroxidans]ABK17765.1 UBA/THIF-type NAD/FAD binding protein [Syntrophobacter fumaroxidans MPOB]
MELKYISFPVEYEGESRLVIDDRSLLEWASEKGRIPRQAVAEAIRYGITPLRYLKNFSALSLDEQLKLCESTVFICGCGGLGGHLVNLAARAGIGSIGIADKDIFFPTNLNRQLFCDTGHMSRPKVHVAEERIRCVNPFVDVRVYPQAVDAGNAEEFIEGADVVLDALDDLPARFILADAARRLGIPFVHGAAAGWWGQVCTFLPDSPLRLSSIYGSRTVKDPSEERMGVLGPTPAVIAGLQALEAIRILAGRQPAYAGRLLYFDGETGAMEIVPLESPGPAEGHGPG